MLLMAMMTVVLTRHLSVKMISLVTTNLKDACLHSLFHLGSEKDLTLLLNSFTIFLFASTVNYNKFLFHFYDHIGDFLRGNILPFPSVNLKFGWPSW